MIRIAKAKLVTVIFGLIIVMSACANAENTEYSELVVGATTIPHAEILTQVIPLLEEKGYILRIVEFDDFNLPNMALDSGEIDVNFFQHIPFMENFNDNHGTNLVPVFGVHFEPLRVYAGRLYSLDNIPDGASIAIPDDPTNEARALQLLEYLGLIQLTPGLGLTATASNVYVNPYNLHIIPLSAELLAPTLPDVDFAVINGNFAFLGGVIDRAIDNAGEAVDSEAAVRFTNYVVVRDGDENLESVRALVNALNSDSIRTFINESYDGRIVPRF